MVAIEEDAYTEALRAFGARNRPRAVALVSAHWTTPGNRVAVTAAPRPPLVYDFGGFPEALYRLTYPARGDARLAGDVVARLQAAGFDAVVDGARGIDHGAWIPMRIAWPDASVPVVQVSLPASPPADLLRMGEALRPLRDEGVLVLGSGGIVHNLRELEWDAKHAPPAEWAAQFDAWMAERIAAADRAGLAAYRERAPWARRAAPTTEHLDPLFVALGAAGGDPAHTVFEGFHHGSLGMRSLEFRAA
jgi:4,5-DOPA dioxygenase extradiol